MREELRDELRRLEFRIEELRRLLAELERRRENLREQALVEGVETEALQPEEVEVEHSMRAVKILLLEKRVVKRKRARA